MKHLEREWYKEHFTVQQSLFLNWSCRSSCNGNRFKWLILLHQHSILFLKSSVNKHFINTVVVVKIVQWLRVDSVSTGAHHLGRPGVDEIDFPEATLWRESLITNADLSSVCSRLDLDLKLLMCCTVLIRPPSYRSHEDQSVSTWCAAGCRRSDLLWTDHNWNNNIIIIIITIHHLLMIIR